MENLDIIYMPTQDELAQHINSAFDSVNLINELVIKSPQENEDAETIARNVVHLQIMMSYDWFSSALTQEQTDQINAVI